MSLAISFSTVRFTKKGGYILQDISPTRDSEEFQNLLSVLRNNPDAPTDIGMDFPLTGRVLDKILSQLELSPIVNRVKQIDPTGMKFVLGKASAQDGFRDFFIIDGAGSNHVRGTGRDDIILGRAGSDTLKGKFGDDFLSGGRGKDILMGDFGADELRGGINADILFGGGQNDILNGGPGSDSLIGGTGADAFIFRRFDFSGQRNDRDIIRGYKAEDGDQIVDTTGDLKIIATGNINLFNGRGTLLENRDTGDLVFVKDAILRQSDINDKFVPPPPGVGNPNNTTRRTDGLDIDVDRIAGFTDGENQVEIYQVRVRNTTEETIGNLSSLVLSFDDANRLNIPANSVAGAELRGKRFVIDDGQPDLAAGSDTTVVRFEVVNRPSRVEITSDDFSPVDFTARDPDGDVVRGSKIGFKLQVREIEGTSDGGSVEVFIRNVGVETITDLEDAVFKFTDSDVDDITAVWGAREKRPFVFDIIPWQGGERGDLTPNERVKLLGFSYEFDGNRRPDFDPKDFRLISDFDDLFA
ncbi:MAG: calcium-binding protein [Pseudomonadota bacterium]